MGHQELGAAFAAMYSASRRSDSLEASSSGRFTKRSPTSTPWPSGMRHAHWLASTADDEPIPSRRDAGGCRVRAFKSAGERFGVGDARRALRPDEVARGAARWKMLDRVHRCAARRRLAMHARQRDHRSMLRTPRERRPPRMRRQPCEREPRFLVAPRRADAGGSSLSCRRQSRRPGCCDSRTVKCALPSRAPSRSLMDERHAGRAPIRRRARTRA